MPNEEKGQNVTTYEIEDKKYTVITKCVDNAQDINQLYDIICRYVISQINTGLHRCN